MNINPEYLMQVYDRMVAESGAKVLFFSRVAAVEMSADDTVDAIIVANKSGLVAFKAKVFIDATGDGDVATWAGASFKREVRMVYCKVLLCASRLPMSIVITTIS